MIFSFYPTKPIGSCDGGMVVSNDKSKIDYLRELSLNGMSYASNNWEREIKFIGYKMYMNSIQAAIATNNFKAYDNKLSRLYEIRSFYNSKLHLANKSDHLYRIKVDNNKQFIDFMKKKNILCGIHYNSLHNHPVYSQNISLPFSEQESLTTVSIPFHEKLTTEELEYITQNIHDYCK